MTDPIPKISVCVPNLNTLPFLTARFESIFNQTFADWELVVCDSFSEDGSWKYIQELAAREPRMKICQTPRQGIYAGFNDCINRARGEYIYIATSDDTMMPRCLETMAAALSENPDCGLCQCGLEIIDENGRPYPLAEQWTEYTLGIYDQKLVHQKNRRLAPHDGMVHPALFTIYTSVTQLLIRRAVFGRIGLFDGQWGAISDFEWEMRAGLLENCVYIPEKLATWRLHAAQATQAVHTIKARLKMMDMCRSALVKAQACVGSRVNAVQLADLVYFFERDILQFGLESAAGTSAKLRFLIGQLFKNPRQILDLVGERARKKRWNLFRSEPRYRQLEKLLRKYNVPAPIYAKDDEA